MVDAIGLILQAKLWQYQGANDRERPSDKEVWGIWKSCNGVLDQHWGT